MLPDAATDRRRRRAELFVAAADVAREQMKTVMKLFGKIKLGILLRPRDVGLKSVINV